MAMRPMSVGLSTTCARTTSGPPRRGTAQREPPDALIDLLLEAGAAGVELDASLEPQLLEELVPRLQRRRDELPVWAVENVCPASRAQAAELASLDREEAKAARAAALETLRLAEEVGARYVVVRLGDVRRQTDEWARARRLWRRGDWSARLATRLVGNRVLAGRPHLDAARRALDELSRRADDAGVILAVRTPSRVIGLPTPLELGVLLADLRGAPIAPLWDLPASALLAELGMPLAETVAAWKGAPIVRASDACGPLAGLAPGQGEVDLPSLLSHAREDAAIVFAPWAELDADEVVAGMESLRRLVAARKKPSGS